ncbi:homeobox-leucine zipper protein ROC6-like isoform X1 [Hordeum vulgare subsp. vulgare]|uniref:homeobox-leucine zipper protein ROC6-like isoform X1 n=1 Tax=Hordeum vulgare subsp. vulgare TaxID=112509 RepID=UPI000B47B5B1|nr:homeobox-leucine zipper protein ROC6-like isoform X1 [Hordeum vulgare subsp. vulgare]
MGMGMQSIPDLMGGGSAAMRLPAGMMGGGLDDGLGGEGVSIDRGALLELGLAAMEELVKVTQVDDPLWQPSLEIGIETLNYDEYRRAFARVLGPSPAGYVSEATREVGIAIINIVDLVNSLMNEARWSEMFPCVVARASTMEIISSGMGGTRSGSIQLVIMHSRFILAPPRDQPNLISLAPAT